MAHLGTGGSPRARTYGGCFRSRRTFVHRGRQAYNRLFRRVVQGDRYE